MAHQAKAIENLKNWRIWLAIILFQLILVIIHGVLGYQNALSTGQEQAFSWDNILRLMVMYSPMAFAGPFIVALGSALEFRKDRWLRVILLHMLLMLPIVVLMQLFGAYFAAQYYNPEWWQDSLTKTLIDYYQHVQWQMDYIYYFALISIGFSLNYYWRIQQQEKEKLSLTKQLVEKELNALKTQLNPHFLFNTLNSAVGLIRMNDKDSAISALTELSAMLRTILENNQKQFVTLKNEMAFVQSYLKIQKLRFSDKLQIDTFVDDDILNCRVPFFLIQPLAENAVQHGAQNAGESNNIMIDVSRSGEMIMVLVSNDMASDSASSGFGMGLTFLTQTLNQFYGTKARIHHYETQEQGQHKFMVEITLPMQEG